MDPGRMPVPTVRKLLGFLELSTNLGQYCRLCGVHALAKGFMAEYCSDRVQSRLLRKGLCNLDGTNAGGLCRERCVCTEAVDIRALQANSR